MKKEEVQLYRETDYKPVIIILIFLKHNINMIRLLAFSFSWQSKLHVCMLFHSNKSTHSSTYTLMSLCACMGASPCRRS